jgi:hypothetical protein
LPQGYMQGVDIEDCGRCRELVPLLKTGSGQLNQPKLNGTLQTAG